MISVFFVFMCGIRTYIRIWLLGLQRACCVRLHLTKLTVFLGVLPWGVVWVLYFFHSNKVLIRVTIVSTLIRINLWARIINIIIILWFLPIRRRHSSTVHIFLRRYNSSSQYLSLKNLSSALPGLPKLHTRKFQKRLRIRSLWFDMIWWHLKCSLFFNRIVSRFYSWMILHITSQLSYWYFLWWSWGSV